MGSVATVEDGAAREALTSVLPRLTALIRSIRNPGAPALGEWNAGQVAVHLAHAWEILTATARGEINPGIERPEDLATFTAAMVSGDERADGQQTASRIEAAASTYLSASLNGSPADPRPWLFTGTALPPSSFTCHLLSESLVHGYDIARAEGRPWRIEPSHAAMAILGFLLPAMSVLDPRFGVDQRHAAGVRACFEIRLRGAARLLLVFDDGALTVEPPGDRRVDWHISADPTAAFLQLWSRTSPLPAMLRGQVVGWGRRPSLAWRLPRMMRNP